MQGRGGNSGDHTGAIGAQPCADGAVPQRWCRPLRNVDAPEDRLIPRAQLVAGETVTKGFSAQKYFNHGGIVPPRSDSTAEIDEMVRSTRTFAPVCRFGRKNGGGRQTSASLSFRRLCSLAGYFAW